MQENSNVIVVIDDDEDDIAIVREAMCELGIENDIISFTNPRDALDYFRSINKSPFFILCDVNMPLMNGFELRRIIYNDDSLLLRATPFIYLTTSSQAMMANKAYALNAQGYFQKPASFSEFVAMFTKIISYWAVAVPPSIFTK